MVVLTETSSGAGTRALVDWLSARGFHTLEREPGRDRGAVLAIRANGVRDVSSAFASAMPWRTPAASIVMPDGPLAVVGVYAPSRDRSNGRADRKRSFLDDTATDLAALNRQFGGRLLVLGDHNAVPRSHTPKHAGFTSWEYGWHDELLRLGLRNVHDVRGDEQPHSWIGRTGNAYLYDYAQVGAALHDAVVDYAYLHSPRERGLSDHAAVTARLDRILAARTSVS